MEKKVWTKERLDDVISSIKPLDTAAMQAAQKRLDELTKPPGSLGRLEALAIRLAGMTGTPMPCITKKAVVIMVGDHGVCTEGVSAYPQEVTPQMVANFLAGTAAVNVLARQAQATVYCVDVGCKAEVDHPDLIRRKVRSGTANMVQEAAMKQEEALAALGVGIELAVQYAEAGYDMLATGEMGIGNTTASAALAVVLGGLSVEAATGKGTGIDDTQREHKKRVIAAALARCQSGGQAEQAAQRWDNPLDPLDPLDALAEVGGLEIAALAGLMIGAASRRCPVMLDGYIATAAALVAVRLAPEAAVYLIASHQSHEQGHQKLLELLGLLPLLQLDMRLGEGTGAVLAFHLVEAALRLMHEMATFASAGVAQRTDEGV